MASDQPRHWALADFSGDAYSLTDAEFAARHGRAFLLHHGPLGSLKRSGRAKTVMMESDAPDSEAVPPQIDFLVFPLTDARGAKATTLCVGRSPESDIIIDDESVSLLHARLFQNVSGEVKMADAGSRNGTFINDEPTPTQGKGPLTILNPGDRVRLGNVVMTFLPVWHFLALARRLSD